MPRLVFDLGDLWQDFKGIVNINYLLWTDPREAPPAIRKADAAFISLLDNQNKTVGVFVPELYELAKVNGLRAQQEEALWKQKHPRSTVANLKKQPFYAELYNSDGSQKTAFELAVLPKQYSDFDKRSAYAIEMRITDEFNNRIDKGQPLPPVVYKYQIESDYLKNLHLLNLRAGGPRDVTLNLINPGSKTPIVDRAAHYIAQRSALLLTLIAVLGLTYTSPLTFAAASIGVLLAKWCGEEFGVFSLVEILLRDIRSNFSRDFALGDKISLKKTIKTAAMVSALAVTTSAVFVGAWAGILSLPIWGAVGAAVGNASVLSACQFALAGFSSAIAAASTFVFGTVGQRFFWGLGIWDKQIDFSKEKAPVVDSPKAQLEKKLAKWQQKFQAEVEQVVSPDERDAFKKQASRQFVQLKTLVKDAAPVEPITEQKRRVKKTAVAH
ncbi:MAG: hypothetical protein HYX61_11100 [Gammaproteobacteria bacterium]|jgi:hypothetical protein|nr:hypothetical protein [Gammaproteobacteria bacterium]